MLIVCNICRSKDIDFRVPRDAIGDTLIEAHFQDKHPAEYQKYLIDKASKERGEDG